MLRNNTGKFQVIVAGGGPVGMATAIELASRNVSVLVCEPRPIELYNVARTNLTNIRSMEHFRRWGIADDLRANDIVPPKVSRNYTFVTRGNGNIILDIEGACERLERWPEAAEIAEWAPLPSIERTLREKLLSLPSASYMAESSVTDFVQTESEVEVCCSGPRGAESPTADYLIIADGARSRLRKTLNLPLAGQTLFQNMSWYFRSAELSDLFEKTKLSSMTCFLNEDAYGDMIVPQGDNQFVYLVSPIPDGLNPNDLDAVKAMMFRSVGQSFQVLDAIGQTWGSHARIATSFRAGRAFLVGDAAHLTPPFGGFGMNMGIGDAVDIGWKIAAVLQGWGGPMLLDSYTIERREVVEFIIKGSVHNNQLWGKALVRDNMEDGSEVGEQVRSEVRNYLIKEKMQQFSSMGAQLGYRYSHSPIIVRDGTQPPSLDYGHYTPSASPGCRVPHIWLTEGTGLDRGGSLYDHLGSGFCLLKLDGDVDTTNLEIAAAKARLPMKILEIEDASLRALFEAKLILVRPDQHVAWRADKLPHDCDRVIDIVRGGVSFARSSSESADVANLQDA